MRQHLNNPFVVIPLALIAFFWGAYSYGLLNWVYDKFLDDSGQVYVQKNLSDLPDKMNRLSVETMRALSRDSWLVSNWIRESLAKNEPFVADYNFDKLPPSIINIDVEEAEKTVILDQQSFETAIATKLGLDGSGYFVEFENVLNLPVRKRVGDIIYLLESGALQIPTFGIAESSRTSEEQRQAIESALSKMKLQGVGTQGEISETSENKAGENNTKNTAFIQVEGAKMEIYKQGELVHRNPNLGLDKIIKGESFDQVTLVDADLNEYSLKSSDLE